MVKRTSTREKWNNIIAYITAVHDQLDDLTDKEQEEKCKERIEWLERNYQISWNQKTIKKMKAGKIFKLE